MLESLRKILFGDDQAKTDAAGSDDVQAAAALLLTEAASLDGEIDDAERSRIRALLESRFSLSHADAERLMAEAAAAQAKQVGSWRPSHTLKEAFDYDQRIELLEMLWDVVYADGVVHDLEAGMMRRLAGLLYVDDQDNGAARKRVVQRLGLD